MNKNKRIKIFAIENEKIMSKWDFDENEKNNLRPENITQGSHIKVNFKCPDCGEKWISEVRYGYKYNGCPICSGKMKVEHWMKTRLKVTNSLFETNPELEKEWDYEKNNTEGLNPNFLTAGSNKIANWICPLGHHYKSHIVNRAKRNTGCTYCSGQAVLEGFNDLQSKNPELAKQWSNKNILLPTEVHFGSKNKFFWICPLGHDDYFMAVSQRNKRQGCPICAEQSQTSFPEQAIYFYLKHFFPDTINRYIKDNKEIDIFIPSKKIGIEYNGYFSHKNKKEKDLKKRIYFESQNIKIIMINEFKRDNEKINADFYINERTSYNDLNELIKKILNKLEINNKLNIDCEKDSIKIKEQYIIQRKENSIASLRPDLVSRWDFEKNGKITPEMVTLGTGQKYYWKCKICNKSYLALPKKIAKGSACSEHRNILKPGVNDFATKYPELLKYWDYDKNTVKPTDVYGGGERIVYWKCDKGHSYQKKILKVIRGEGCGICNGKKVLVGFNDLATAYPELIKEWDYNKNENTPDMYVANSNKEVWWICSKCNHSWKSKIANRKQCPNCKKIATIINVYLIETGEKVNSFDNIKDLCSNLNVDYNKNHGNISSICKRRQKTLMNLYILRYDVDDEFKELSNCERKIQINNYINNKNKN